MKKTIEKIVYDTEQDTCLAKRFAGEFGSPEGFEERLLTASNKQHYLYGVGGPESPYPKPTIILLTLEEKDKWKKDNDIE
jgi:hypothetical protein